MTCCAAAPRPGAPLALRGRRVPMRAALPGTARSVAGCVTGTARSGADCVTGTARSDAGCVTGTHAFRCGVRYGDGESDAERRGLRGRAAGSASVRWLSCGPLGSVTTNVGPYLAHRDTSRDLPPC